MVGTGPNYTDTSRAVANYSDIHTTWYHIGPLSQNFTLLDESAGLSKFWFEIDEGDGTAPVVADQDSVGFVLQDKVMLSNSSCIESGSGTAHIDIAVSGWHTL